jgi:hypothetical protein
MRSFIATLVVLTIAFSQGHATSYDDRARAAWAWAQAETPAAKVQAQRIVQPVKGLHSHRCAACGYVWSHGEDSFGNVAAHTCPKCGRGPWWYKFSP